MARDPNRKFDKTSLKVLDYPGVHRDYAAHFFRWGFISSRFMNHQTRILDIGCGVDTPLAKVISNTNNFKMIPRSYLGVDLNKRPANLFHAKWAQFMFDFNFAENWRCMHTRVVTGSSPRKYVGQFDLITCLEVVEHMNPEAVAKLLTGAHELLAPGGKFILSTPVFNGKAAANHINEMTVDTLAAALRRAGFVQWKRYGTFMSDGDRKKCASSMESEICERLKEYYSGEVVACFLAPLYPNHSRNNIWIIQNEAVLDDLNNPIWEDLM